jgi:ABC-type multidrug transport system fused ATPase/permease subunit
MIAKFQLQCIHSVLYNAHQYLLTIDPHYHIKRSSGVILGKIERAARGYEDILDQIIFEFAPLIVGITTIFILLSRYSVWLVAAIALCLIIIIGYGYYFAQYTCRKWENAFIKSDDDFKATAFENLAQVHLIRATFATDYMRNKLTQKINVNSQTERDLWISYGITMRIFSLLYALSTLILIGFFAYRVHHNITSLPFAIGFILAYIQSTKDIIKILHYFRKYMRGYAAIQDLFSFMPSFGKQTIPVFNGKEFSISKKSTLQLVAQNISFGYGDGTIFNGHSLHIELPSDQQNKLFGIIGPSGVGKTTLLSILGGQLRPTRGNVSINGIDIYVISDTVRRNLIALQGQIATSIKGSVRYNLLFGLPQEASYTDQYLYEILARVGLEKIFREHEGLDTILGEGALNISGGQRQRLNFAGLYLRAQYYKPALILIDEPTSSLDEISELAITTMIQELASSAITLVIAHRLKTLKDAVGLIDLSLLTESTDIQIHNTEELEEESEYYRQLITSDENDL